MENLLSVHREEYLPAIRAAGVEIFEPSARETAAFRKATEPVYADWRRRVGDTRVADRALDLLHHS